MGGQCHCTKGASVLIDHQTLRDYFAVTAMSAMIAQYPCQAIDCADGGINIDMQALAGDAYEMADAMLTARAARETNTENTGAILAKHLGPKG